MATRESRSGSASAENQARLEHDTQLAGMAAAFGRAGELGPQVLALQQAVLSGIARSQRREARRLEALGTPDDPRIADALERAERFDAFNGEFEQGAKVAQQFISTFQQDGRFQGYVTHADGAPAAGYTVQLKLRSPNQKEPASGTAQTDSAGYFRIDLALANQGRSQAVPAPERWAERFAQMASTESSAAEPADAKAAPNAAPAATVASAQAAGGSAIESSVQVFDPNERLVFEDPVPPTFDDGMSEFRYYLLPEAGQAADRPG